MSYSSYFCYYWGLSATVSVALGTARKLKGGAEEVVSMRRYALSAKAKKTVAVEVLRMMALAEEEVEVEANETEKTRNMKGTREPVARISIELPLTFHATFSAPPVTSYDLQSSFCCFHG